MSLYKPNITKTSPADRKKLERASALALPTNPTARGMTADQIKAALWIPIFGSDVSLLKELDRVVDAVNSYLLHLYTYLENGVPGTGGGGSDTESVKVHNTDPASHADIRDMIQKVSNRLQAIADSNDISLDQLSEIVGYIKDNRGFIDAITTSKVNVSDIIDNLETNLSNKPLSAKQGVVLHKQITDLEKDKLNASELDPAIADALLQANEAIAQHNTDKLAHREVFGVLEDLQRRVAGLLDTDDTTLDQLSEIVGYIKDNRGFIDAITTSKVNVSDIIDNLITSATNKPLSAKQGVVLKGLIDALTTNKLNASALEPAIAQVLLDAQAQVNAHNTSEESHADLRLLISDYYADVKSLLDTDDKTLDQTSEIVAYIKKNKSLIDNITTAKVNVADIVDNLVTNLSNKPLSAAQGVALKRLIDALSTEKLNVSALSSAITQALSEAKASGAFDGEDGKTPVKGTDYFTEEDKAEIARLVIESIGVPVYGFVDEDNIIVLTGELDDVTYKVKYKMEDGSTIDIGNLVLDTNTYYSVTNTLTNCTNSNSATEVIKGESYSATVSAVSGYKISSIMVTMGGTDITSSVVSGGTISITSVTGDIVVTAVADEQAVAPTYTNQIPISTDDDGNLFVGANGEKGYKTNTRLSISAGGETTSDAEGCEVTGYIPAVVGDVLRIKNITTGSDSRNALLYYDANKKKKDSDYTATIFSIDEGNGVYASNGLRNVLGLAYIRFASENIDETSIVTRNEEIV